MNADFLAVLEFWEREKGINRDVLSGAVQEALLSAAKRAVGPARELRVVIAALAGKPTAVLMKPVDASAPAELHKAHQALDRAVDRCYRPGPFPSDRHRVEYLFALYEKITAPLVAAAKPKRKRR